MIKIDKDCDALLIVDLQNDFCPDGALGVPGGDSIVPVINALIPYFSKIYATQDWHPVNHISFVPQGGIWPPHCVADTPGAELHPGLQAGRAIRIRKGTDPKKEAYSGFQGTNLVEMLRNTGVKRLIVSGLATDYCVKATAIDAVNAGFHVVVLSDTVRGVNVNSDDSLKAFDDMRRAGVEIAESGISFKIS
jgi:nicotinamidase/pyrazinamidase